MFKNKHVVVAVIVAPILAIIAYLGVDRLVSEKPHVAKSNVSYPLALKSGCRYASGECRLENGDVKITLMPAVFSNQNVGIRLVSSVPLDGAKIAVTTATEDGVPLAFESDDPGKQEWIIALPVDHIEKTTLRLVVFSGETLFFAEIDSIFLVADNAMKQR